MHRQLYNESALFISTVRYLNTQTEQVGYGNRRKIVLILPLSFRITGNPKMITEFLQYYIQKIIVIDYITRFHPSFIFLLTRTSRFSQSLFLYTLCRLQQQTFIPYSLIKCM